MDNTELENRLDLDIIQPDRNLARIGAGNHLIRQDPPDA